MKSKVLWISEGDVTGISYEILEKARERILEFSNTHVVCLIQAQNQFKLDFAQTIKVEDLQEISRLQKGLYQVCIASKTKFLSLKLGKPSSLSGKCSYEAFLKTIEYQKTYDGNILTLPLSKEFVLKSGLNNKFQGHTEELEKAYNTKTIMLMYSKEFSVIPLTTHIPLKQVPTKIQKVNLEYVCKTLLNSKLFPKLQIGICGLNPHCGENGKIGTEEKDWIKEKIKHLQRKYPIHNIISADSIFTKEIRKNFDVILAWYHDQGLIPFKAIAGKTGINVTLGLPFFRVSPDHGPAYDIAGKGLASSESLETCFEFLTKHN